MGMPNLSLEGKVALVTGGKRGIGKAIALTFAEASADVAICSRGIEDGELEAVAREIRNLGRSSLAMQTDISHKADVDNVIGKVVAEFGKVDVLVNNAGINIRAPFLEISEEDVERLLAIDLKGYLLCAQAAGR